MDERRLNLVINAIKLYKSVPSQDSETLLRIVLKQSFGCQIDALTNIEIVESVTDYRFDIFASKTEVNSCIKTPDINAIYKEVFDSLRAQWTSAISDYTGYRKSDIHMCVVKYPITAENTEGMVFEAVCDSVYDIDVFFEDADYQYYFCVCEAISYSIYEQQHGRMDISFATAMNCILYDCELKLGRVVT